MSASEESFVKYRKGRRSFAALARRLWPAKTAAEVAFRAGVSRRTAENWLAGATSPNAEHMAALLRSDIGFDVLDELMHGAEVQWWRAVKVRVRMAELERRSFETRRALEDLRHEVAGLDSVGSRVAVPMVG